MATLERRNTSTTVTVDVENRNDEVPMFLQGSYMGNVSEGVPAEEFVLSVRIP